MAGAPPLRVAVAGAGFYSQFHLDAWRRIDGVEVVGLCDVVRARAEERAARFGVPRVFDDHARMLDELRPDLVDVVTPQDAHPAQVAEATRRGLATVCQKPLARDLDAALAMVRRARADGALLIVHEDFRFQPWYREARRLLDAGVLGDPHGIAFRLRPGDGQGEAAYLDRQPFFQKMERFLIHETAIHLIDTFRFLMGEVRGVFARLRRVNPTIAGEDAGYVVFEFQSGATGLFDGNRLNDHVADNPRLTMGEMWLEGSGGVLRLDGSGRLWLKPHRGPEAEHRFPWADAGPGGDSVLAFQRHVVDHLRAGAPLETGAEDYLTNIAVEEAVYRSHAEGRWIGVEAPAP